jgi:DNA primase catalytic subunit
LALRDYLEKICDFKSVLFVFSGRRGFNCYVLDSFVWSWTRAQRTAILRQAPSFIVFDEAVTIDPMHLIKVPLVPHHATGIITAPIKDLETFLPSMGIHYSKAQNANLDEWRDWIDHALRSAK